MMIAVLVDERYMIGDHISASYRNGDDQVVVFIFMFGDLNTEFLIQIPELLVFQGSSSKGY
jgi:hypothetical protein